MADPKFMCPRCPFERNKPRTLGYLREHLARAHLQLALWSCPKCREGFATPHMAYGHFREVCYIGRDIPMSNFTYNLLNVDLERLVELQKLEKEAILNTCYYLSQQKPPQKDDSSQTDPEAPPPMMPFFSPFFPPPPFLPPPHVPSNEGHHGEMEHFPMPSPFPVLPPLSPVVVSFLKDEVHLKNQENDNFSIGNTTSRISSKRQKQLDHQLNKLTVGDVLRQERLVKPPIGRIEKESAEQEEIVEEMVDEEMVDEQPQEEEIEEETEPSEVEEKSKIGRNEEESTEQEEEEEIQEEEEMREEEQFGQEQFEEEEEQIGEEDFETHEIVPIATPADVARQNRQDALLPDFVRLRSFDLFTCKRVPVIKEEKIFQMETPLSPQSSQNSPPLKKVRFFEREEIINIPVENEIDEEEEIEEERPKRRKNPPRAAKKT